MGILKVKISEDLLTQILTTGYECKASRVIDGIPKGSKLIGAILHRRPGTKDVEGLVVLELEFSNLEIPGWNQKPKDIVIETLEV